MCRIVKNAFSAFSPESFPSFCAVSGGLVLQKDRRSLLDSLRFLELEEKFLARLMFALQDPVRALEELCPLIDRAISALSPFREQMEAEAKKQPAVGRTIFQTGDFLLLNPIPGSMWMKAGTKQRSSSPPWSTASISPWIWTSWKNSCFARTRPDPAARRLREQGRHDKPLFLRQSE